MLGKLSSPWTQALLLYAGYVVLSLAIFLTFPGMPDIGDNYHGQARNILEGRGFSDPSLPKAGVHIPESSLLRWWEKNDISFGSTRPNQPTARCMPLYPLWLAFWFWIFGFASPAVGVIQIFVMGLTVPLIYYIGQKLFGSNAAGLLAGLIVLVHPHLLRYPGSYPSEALFIPLFISGVAAWFWCRERPTPLRLALYTLVWTLAGLTRELGIAYGLASIALLVAFTPALRRYFYVPLIVLALCWSPWVYRNAVVMNSARLFPTRSGYNLWLTYNRIYLNRFLKERDPQEKYPVLYFVPPENESILKDELGVPEALITEYRKYDFPLTALTANEVEMNRELMDAAILFLKAHPEIVVKFSVLRLVDAFVGHLTSLGQVNYSGASSVYLLVLFLVGLAGLGRAVLRFKDYWYILILTGLYLFLLAVGPWGARYRLPLDPLLALFAGGLLWEIFEAVKRKQIA